MTIKSERAKIIEHNANMVEAALEALIYMANNPGLPVDLSDQPVGCFPILRGLRVKLLFSGGEVFGIQGLPDDAAAETDEGDA